MKQVSRHGATIVELFVSLGIVGLLLAVLLPAVQAVRERARKTSCINNLRQIGTAYHSVHDTFRTFPPVSRNVRIATFPSAEAPLYATSAHYDLLPGLGYGNAYSSLKLSGDRRSPGDPPQSFQNQSLLETQFSVFQCGSDPLSEKGVSYLICNGTSTIGESILGTSRENSVFPGVAQGPTAADIQDGLSNTVAFSERLVGDQNSADYTPARDWAWVVQLSRLLGASPVLPNSVSDVCRDYVSAGNPHASFNSVGWLFGDLGVTNYNHILTPNSSIPDCATSEGGFGAYSARSLHSGGVSVLFADGSVKFLNDEIQVEIWRGLGSIKGGENY